MHRFSLDVAFVNHCNNNDSTYDISVCKLQCCYTQYTASLYLLHCHKCVACSYQLFIYVGMSLTISVSFEGNTSYRSYLYTGL